MARPSASSPGTIFALASGAGRAGVAVLRLSGPASGAAVTALAGRLPAPRRATLARLSHGGETLDDALVLWFPAPASFTGEDVAELHVHGGRAVIAAMAAALTALGLRPAEPGEFSRRAFANGKLDLTAAEAVADLVAADTAAQRRQALRQMEGGLARLYDAWREALIRAQAHLETAIDFADEDIPADLADTVWPRVADLAGAVRAHLAQAPRGERLREGLHVAILGAPNVGKSSLLNRLAGRDAAIVSETAGTTRDVVEVHLDLQGWPVIVADTAGLRDTPEAIETEGVRRARARAETADLKLLVFDAATLPEWHADTLALRDGDSLVVVNKVDLLAAPPDRPALLVSAGTGQGMDALEAAVAEAAERLLGGGEAALPTRLRHRAALSECLAALERAPHAPGVELAAEDLRLAARALGRITGRVDVEDLLDVIFRDFCIGK